MKEDQSSILSHIVTTGKNEGRDEKNNETDTEGKNNKERKKGKKKDAKKREKKKKRQKAKMKQKDDYDSDEESEDSEIEITDVVYNPTNYQLRQLAKEEERKRIGKEKMDNKGDSMDIDDDEDTGDDDVTMEENTEGQKDTDGDGSVMPEKNDGKGTKKPVDLKVQTNLYGGETGKLNSPKKRKTPAETKKYSNKVEDIDKAETKKNNDEDSTDTGQSRKKKLKGKKAKRIGDKKRFKEINTYSANRRECKRVEYEDSSEDEKTPDHSNSKSFFKHPKISRCTVRLKIESTNDAKKAAVTAFREFYKEMVEADSSIQFYTWKESKKIGVDRIKKESDIPEDLKGFSKFSSKFFVYPNSKSMTLYPMFRIGHTKELSDIREEMQEWSHHTSTTFFHNMLQCESATEVGWFLYSTRAMDAGALADEISDALGFQLGLRWKVINIGIQGKVPEEKKVHALIVEVDTTRKWAYQRRLIEFYGREIKESRYYPNGIRLRFVKAKKDAASMDEKCKIDKLRARQKAFNSSIKSTQTYDIVHLDYGAAPGQPTLRQMIGEIKSRQYETTPLFHNVALDWRRDGFIFEYSPKMQDEAECMVNFLLPYLQFHFPEARAHHYFTNDCVIRCGDYHVDPSTGYVVDAEINGTEFDPEAEDGIIGFNLSIPTSLEIGAPQRPEKDRLAPGPDDDDDSVSTLGRPRSKVSGSITSSSMSPHFHPITDTRSQRNNKCSNQDGITDDTSVMSSTSTVTWQTVASLESKISALAADSNAKFDAIMKSLGINDNNTDNRKITSENTATVDETGTSQTVKASSEAGGNTKVSSGNVS